MVLEKVGRYAFYAGIVISVVAGLIDVGSAGITILAILGIVVGFLNVTGKEVDKFLLGALSLVVAGLALKEVFGGILGNMLVAYIAFTSASALVVALREVYTIQKNR